jgi:hypothetical protein
MMGRLAERRQDGDGADDDECPSVLLQVIA